MNQFPNYFKFQFGHFLVYFYYVKSYDIFGALVGLNRCVYCKQLGIVEIKNLSSTTPGTRGVIKICTRIKVVKTS